MEFSRMGWKPEFIPMYNFTQNLSTSGAMCLEDQANLTEEQSVRCKKTGKGNIRALGCGPGTELMIFAGDCLGVDLNRNFPSGWGRGEATSLLLFFHFK